MKSYLHVPRSVPCHPLAVDANETFSGAVYTTWNEIELVMEQRMVKERLQALNRIAIE
jgi:hypothetical protein